MQCRKETGKVDVRSAACAPLPYRHHNINTKTIITNANITPNNSNKSNNSQTSWSKRIRFFSHSIVGSRLPSTLYLPNATGNAIGRTAGIGVINRAIVQEVGSTEPLLLRISTVLATRYKHKDWIEHAKLLPTKHTRG